VLEKSLVEECWTRLFCVKKERHKSDHFKLHSGSWVVQVVCQTSSDKCIKNDYIQLCEDCVKFSQFGMIWLNQRYACRMFWLQEVMTWTNVKDCQVDEQMLNVQNKNSSYFVEWIPNNIKARPQSENEASRNYAARCCS